VKVCPECETINHAARRTWLSCGYEFPPPEIAISRTAAKDAVLSIQLQPEWLDVTSVTYRAHTKPGKPPSLRVTYMCGFVSYSEWVCLEHSGFAREKAVKWWQRRAPAEAQHIIPATVDEALTATADLRQPVAIQVKPVGQYTEITAVRFA
jgi:DNA repair protein RadD